MSDLTANETVDLLQQALNLPVDYEGEIILHFGQKMGLRNPQIQNREIKKKLLPAIIALCKPVMFEPGDGGKVKVFIVAGRFGYVVPQDNRLEDVPGYRNQVEHWNSYLLNDNYRGTQNTSISSLLATLNKTRTVWDYSVDCRKRMFAIPVKVKSRLSKFIG